MFFKTKIISVHDIEKKIKIQDTLAANNIKYTLKTKPFHRQNTYDAAKLGMLADQKIQYVYSFYVDKKEKEKAIMLIKHLWQ